MPLAIVSMSKPALLLNPKYIINPAKSIIKLLKIKILKYCEVVDVLSNLVP